MDYLVNQLFAELNFIELKSGKINQEGRIIYHSSPEIVCLQKPKLWNRKLGSSRDWCTLEINE